MRFTIGRDEAHFTLGMLPKSFIRNRSAWVPRPVGATTGRGRRRPKVRTVRVWQVLSEHNGRISRVSLDDVDTEVLHWS